jgi:hypothetical protein
MFAATAMPGAEPRPIRADAELFSLVVPGLGLHRPLAARAILRSGAESLATGSTLGPTAPLRPCVRAELSATLTTHLVTPLRATRCALLRPMPAFGAAFRSTLTSFRLMVPTLPGASFESASLIFTAGPAQVGSAAAFKILTGAGLPPMILNAAAFARALVAGSFLWLAIIGATIASALRARLIAAIFLAVPDALFALGDVFHPILTRAGATALCGRGPLAVGLHRPRGSATPEQGRQNRRRQPTLRDFRTHTSLLFRVPNAEVVPTRTCRDATARGGEPR